MENGMLGSCNERLVFPHGCACVSEGGAWVYQGDAWVKQESLCVAWEL